VIEMALLDRLDEVDWTKVSHAYGPATDVPELLRALVDPDTTDAEHARVRHALYGNLIHQGTVWSASSKAVPFFVEIVMDDSLAIEIRRFALRYLCDLTIGEEIDELVNLGEFDPDEYFANARDPGTWREEDRLREEDEEALEQMVRVWAKDCYEAAEANLPRLLPLLEGPNDDLCFTLINLVAAFPRCANHTIPALRSLENDPQVDSERREAVAETLPLLD
jgi:hypothetical protein